MTTFVDRQSVTIIIIKADTILMNLRDDKDGIWNPNMWSMIGGHVEKTETLLEAVLREVHEETGQLIASSQLHPLVNFHYAGINTMTTIFSYKCFPHEFLEFECNEGVESQFVLPEVLLSGQIYSGTTGKKHDVAPEHLDTFQRMKRCLPS